MPPGPDVIHGQAPSARARLEWGTPPQQATNVLSAGFGTVVGFWGVQYTKFLAPTPVALYAGAGGLGVGAGLELTLPRLVIGDASASPIGDIEACVTLGLFQDWGRSPPHAGSLMLETGLRRWQSSRTLFIDVGIGGRREIWGSGTPASFISVRALLGLAI
jgi:hypothetical protein